MKAEAQKHVVGAFARINRLDPGRTSTKVKRVIAHAVAPFYLLGESLDPSGLSNSPNPIDGILITLLSRLFDVVSGTLSLLAIERLQQAEILSRTVMESALSLQYIAESESKSGQRIVQYFESYIEQERQQNRKWKAALVGLDPLRIADHEARIGAKSDVLDGAQLFVDHFAASVGAKNKSGSGFPNFLGICTALGKAVEYRTVYAAMCSQAHHDAEDILNDFIVGSSPIHDQLYEQLEREKNNFSVFLVLHGLRYYLETLGKLGERFHFIPVVQQSAMAHAAISEMALEVSSSGFIGNSTEGWVSN